MTRKSRWTQAVVLCATVLCLAAAHLLGHAGGAPAQEVAGLHEQPIFSESSQNVVAIGTARDKDAERARVSSGWNARYRLATDLNRRLYGDPRKPVVSFRHLMDYVSRFSRQTGWQVRPVDGTTEAYARLELNKAFVDPLRIRSMARGKPARGRAEGYLLVTAEEFVEHVKGKAPVTVRVRVEADSIRAGSFQFVFVVVGVEGKRADLRLDQIEVEQDGSPGSATWAFTITETVNVVSGEQARNHLLVIPARSYNDDVGAYPMGLDLAGGVSTANPNLEIQIVGERR